MIWFVVQWPGERLRVVFCDVGQGDSALVILGRFQALIDTGDNKLKLLSCLGKQMPFWDRKIEVLFVSHPDKDHSGLVDELKKIYEVEMEITKPEENDIVRYANLSFDILKGNHVDDDSDGGSKDTNKQSVIMRLRYGEFSVLFVGDIDLSGELAVMDMGVLKKTEVLKVSHHGSKYGSGAEFLDKVKPRYAVISVSAKNNYGHPSSDTLLRLDAVGAKVLRTDIDGMITFETNGVETWVKKEK